MTGPSGEAFGTAIGGAGDIDGDGFDDWIVGSPINTGNGGSAYLYRGSATIAAPTPSQKIAAPTACTTMSGCKFGDEVGILQDVNGDQLDEAAVAGSWANSGSPPWGATYVYLGNGSGTLASAPTQTRDGAAGFNAGCGALSGIE
jgi:hypothetical protein